MSKKQDMSGDILANNKNLTAVDYFAEWRDKISQEWVDDYSSGELSHCVEVKAEYDDNSVITFTVMIEGVEVNLVVNVDKNQMVVGVEEPVSSNDHKLVDIFSGVVQISNHWQQLKNGVITTSQKGSFTPRDYEVEIHGIIVTAIIGKITHQAYNYWKNGVNAQGIELIDIDQYVGEDKSLQVPDYARIFPDNDMFCLDDVYHEFLASRGDSIIRVIDDNGAVVLESYLDDGELLIEGIQTNMVLDVDDLLVANQPVYIGKYHQTGMMFRGCIELDEPFDVGKLAVGIVVFESVEYVHSVFYNGQRIDEIKFDTYSEGFECEVYLPV